MSKATNATIIALGIWGLVELTDRVQARFRRRNFELALLNMELSMYGYKHMEPTLKNARVMVEYERRQRAEAKAFKDLIEFNGLS